MFRSKRNKIITSLTLAASFIFQIVSPTVGLALTSGPSQPEVQSFEPVSTTQMVDPFTGDFTYNIPLLDVGGYPVNISYHAGIGMDQEASWVGLGWNINPGVINRNMRGLPDDFDGDEIEKITSVKHVTQVGINPRMFSYPYKVEDELYGEQVESSDKVSSIANEIRHTERTTIGVEYYNSNVDFLESSFDFQVYYNSYKGVGYNLKFNKAKTQNGEFSGGIGMGFDSQNGYDIAPSLHYRNRLESIKNKNLFYDANTSVHFSSRGGMVGVGMGIGFSVDNRFKYNGSPMYSNFDFISGEDGYSSYNVESKDIGNYLDNGGGAGLSSTIGFNNPTYIPVSRPNQFSYNTNVKFKYYNDRSGSASPNSEQKFNLEASVSVNGVHSKTMVYKGYGYLNDFKAGESDLTDMANEGVVEFNKFTNNLRPSSGTYDVLTLSAQGNSGGFKPVKNYLSMLYSPSNRIFSISKVGLPVELGITEPKEVDNISKWRIDSETESGSAYDLFTEDAFKWQLYAKSTKLGFDPTLTYAWGGSGLWSNGNNLGDDLKSFSRKDFINSLFQKSYYINLDEVNKIDDEKYQYYGGVSPMKLKIDKNNLSSNKLLSIFQLSDGSEKILDVEDFYFNKRQRRKENIQILRASEAKEFGVEKNIFSYSYNPSTKLNDRTTIGRTDNFRKAHHISEVISTTSSGERYIYGLPVYNTEQVDYNFNVGENNSNLDYYKFGMATYAPTDKSVSNQKGVNNYYSHEKTPSYVHAWMLTCVLSSDYVDVTGDGPTNDDIGGYTKFNYQKLQSSSSPVLDDNVYRWRFPFQNFKANINRGMKADELDDYVNISTGKKEVWYLQSIETKTHIAIFHTSDRLDGVEVASEDGGAGSMKLKKLDKIELFNLKDFYQNPTTRVPIKTVYFEYSYDLCPNVPNNTGATAGTHPLNTYNPSKYNKDINFNKGKLTLQKIWYSYGNSLKGGLSPYIFEYNGGNYEYAPKSVDRWGNYKPWNYHNGYTNSYAGYNNDGISNAEYPYVPQENSAGASVNAWASAWCLTNIKLPSGGKINVEYEADDYAYVQNKKAMQMLTISGFSNNIGSPYLSNRLYNDADKQVNKYLLFKMPDHAGSVTDLLGDIKSIFGSFYVKINPIDKPSGYSAKYEHIQTYMDLELDANGAAICGTKTIGSVLYGYVKIKPAFKGDNASSGVNDEIHPVTKNALLVIRESLSHLAYPGNNARRGEVNAKAIAGNLISFIPELIRTLAGFENYLIKSDYAQEVKEDNSYIRLLQPNGFKKGGGCRVKKIMFDDFWNEMTMGEETSFVSGQEYSYTIYDEDQKRIISSGVASYEPMVGGNENPFKDRIQFDDGTFTLEEKNLFAPNNFRYEEGPLGESYFPAANVGYRRIKVKNVIPTDINPDLAKKHSNGYTVSEFYTYKDFPIIAKRTGLDAHINKNFALSLVGISKETALANQGFLIEVNDMHGKPKANSEYSAYDENKIIKGVRYDYLVDNDNARELHLKNEVTLMGPDGVKTNNKLLGLDIEVVTKAEASEHNALTSAAKINMNYLYPLSGTPPVIPVLNIIPSVSFSRSKVQVATLTKLVKRSGILKRTITIVDDANLVTENLCWDSETGSVLLSRTQNERWTWDYNLTKPAHWIYEGMSAASKNSDLELLLSTTGAANPGEMVMTNVNGFGTRSSAALENLLYPGDELIAGYDFKENLKNNIANYNGTTKYWVLSVSNGKVNLIDKEGVPIPQASNPYYFKVLRSGHRNHMNTDAEMITSQSDPTASSNWATLSQLQDVISGSALLYSDQWQIYYQKNMKARINCELTQQPYYEEMVSTTPPYSVIVPSGKQTDFSNSTNWPEHEICNGKQYYAPGQSVNPYVLGIRGNWRPWYSMVYYDRTNSTAERTQTWAGGDGNQIDIGTAGLIQNYVPFYQRPSSQWVPQWLPGSPAHNQWTWKDKISLMAANGEAVENMDVLGVYSSALYGYQKTLPVAVADNAQYHQMMFDGFEEYDQGFYTIDCALGNVINLQYYPTNNPIFNGFFRAYSICNNTWHWPLWKAMANGNARISENKSHTGKQSLVVATPYVPQSGSVPEQASAAIYLDPNTAITGNYPVSNGRFYLSQTDFIPQFYPTNTGVSSQYYLLSYWVYGNGSIKLKDQNGVDLAFQQIGNSITIDGWKRIEGKVTLPAGKSIHQVAFFNFNTPYLNNGSGNPVILNYPTNANVMKPVYFDDMRILPFMGSMNSYVYNKNNRRLMANLSENNFATFFEYDEEGNLIRTKVETEKGIMTVNENRSSIRKR